MGNKASTRAPTPAERAFQQALSRPSALHASMFGLSPAGHHGVPLNTKTMAFCGLQGILAIGTANGNIKLYGRDGLEFLIEAPRSTTSLAVGVIHMKFTAYQRLVVTYSNSSIRIYSLTNPTRPQVEIPETWTTSTITCIETIKYQNFPYFFVAVDDGNIHVFHEETGKTSTYVITPRECGITTSADDKHLQVVTAMAVNPRDANQLLIAFEVSSTIYQWDLAKHKLPKDFTLAKGKSTPAPRQDDPNSVQSLSWHSSGKRFVAGYKYGGFGVFRYDKPHGLYHTLPVSMSSDETHTPISRIEWICAPPASRHSHLPGAIIIAGGRTKEDANVLTIVFPPRELSDEDAITTLMKSEQLTWHSTTVQAKNHSEIAAFAVAADQVDYCSRLAPFSVIILSGNPMDGQQPVISVQGLPGFVRLREEDKEDWEWIPERMPKAVFLPPLLLQQSAVKTVTVVNLAGCDGALQADLLAAVDKAAIDPIFQLMTEQDFDWPINGGSVLEPLHKGFMPPSSGSSNASHVFQSSTILLTGHANGFVIFWEVHSSSERASRGTLKILHVVDVAGQINPVPTNAQISCVEFCSDSRTLVVGFAGGEFAVLEFGQRSRVVKNAYVEIVQLPKAEKPTDSEVMSATDVESNVGVGQENSELLREEAIEDRVGYHVVFSLHIHSSEIKKICFSSTYNYAAIADDAGVVSLIELSTHNYELLIFDVSSDEPVSVESLLLSELVQVTEIPVPTLSSSPSGSPNGSKSGSKSPPARSQFDRRSISSPPPDQMTVIQHREVVTVLFVGRGNGKLEMFHMQSAKKIGESLFDPHKVSPLSSIIMLDATGKRVDIQGREWVKPPTELIVNDMVDNDLTSGVNKLLISPELEQLTEQALAEAIANATETEMLTIQSNTGGSDEGVVECDAKWSPSDVIETKVPAGSLGLHLFTEVQQHAIVKGFVLENEKALALAAKGVRPGHVIVSINGVDLLPYSREVVCTVLHKLRDLEKVMIFAKGFGPLPDTSGDPEVGSVQDALAEKPRLLLCTCGKSLHLIQVTLPKAAEIAIANKEEQGAQPIASIDVSSQILATSIIRVPVLDNVENCVVVIDQSNRLYVISLMTLTMVWSADCPALGSALDGIHCSVAANGELIVANTFGEIDRLSILSDATQKENAVFERVAVKTRIHLDERVYPLEKDQHPSPKKKGGIAALKKLVSGSKEAHDLNKVFQFSAEDADRRQLFGDRKSAASPKTQGDEKTAVKKTSEGLGATKDALNQAAQHLQQRGEKLNDLGLKTEQMRDTAEDFYKTMKAFNDKNENKKWYEF